MNLLKVWYCLCTLFCVYILCIVWHEQYEVTYRLDYERPMMRFLSCVPLNQIYAGQPAIDLDQMRVDLYEHLLKMRFNSAHQDSNDFIRNATESINYLILLDSLCFVCENNYELNLASLFFNYVNVKMFAFDVVSFDLIKMDKPFDMVTHLIVIHEDHPFSACRDRAYSRFHCLNDCFKSKNRLAKYYYSGDETGEPVLLNYQDDLSDYPGENRSIMVQEKGCFKQCKTDACRLSHFVLSNHEIYTLKTAKRTVYLKSRTFQAHRIIDRSNFWLQQIGLVCLLVGCSVRQLSFKLAKAVNTIIRQKHPIRQENPIRRKTPTGRDYVFLKGPIRCPIKMPFLKVTILMVCLFCSAYLYTQMILDYKARQSKPVRKEITMRLMQPETVHLIVCVHFRDILPGKGLSYLDGLTLSQLETLTELKSSDLVEAISLNYQNKLTPAHWRLVNTSTIFRFKERCYKLEIYPVFSEPRYQMVLSISKLSVKLKKSAALFLLVQNEQFSLDSYFLQLVYNFYKVEIKRSEPKCVHYEQLYSRLYPNCNSRKSCIDTCINRLSVKTHGRLTSWILRWVAHKNHFSESEWKRLTVKHDFADYKNLRTVCEEEIVNNASCNEVRFEQGTEIDYDSSERFNIELYYEVIRLIEEVPCWSLITLDILNVQTIFYGLNVLTILRMLHCFARTKFKLTNARLANRLALIFLLCLTGFACHTLNILSQTLNDDLTYSQHYQIADVKRMPTIVLCYNYPLIDRKRRLTGRYLNELTSNLRPDTVFRNISYLDEQSEWITLESNFKGRNFEIETFFFLSRKCFGLKLNLSYRNDQFYFSFDRMVLKVYFNHSFLAGNLMTTFFMTEVPGSIFFSRVSSLHFPQQKLSKVFSIIHSSIFLRYDDKFNTIRHLIRSPLSLLHGQNNLHDARAYLSGLLKGFRLANPKRVTLNLPVTEGLFDYEIDDEAFERYFSEVQNVTDHRTPANSNYEREFVVNTLSQRLKITADHPLEGSHFAFGLNYLAKVIVATNEQSYSSLILSLLNVLSIWFGLGVLDLHVCIRPLAVRVRLLCGCTRFLCSRFFRLKFLSAFKC